MGRKVCVLFIFFFISILSYAQTHGLEAYIRQGIQNSPLLKDYENQLQSGIIDSLLLKAGKKPAVNGIGLIIAVPSYKGWGYDDAITNGGNYSALASASQSIFTKKIYAPQYEAVNLTKQSVSNASKISEHDLKKTITDLYLSAYASLRQMQFVQAAYLLLKDEELILQEFVQHGVYKQTDYLSFEIAVQSQEIQIKQSLIRYKMDLRDLNIICGISDTSYQTLDAPIIYTAVSRSAEASPFFKQFKIDSLKITNQKSLVDIKYLPKLNWFADAGLLGSNPAMLYKNFGTSFGLNFSVPIYDGNQKNLQYQKLAVTESTRNNYQIFFKTQYSAHIMQVRSEIKQIEQLTGQIKNQLNTSETLINASRQQLTKGALSVTDFIITIKNDIDIKNQLNQSEMKKLQLTNELNYWNW